MNEIDQRGHRIIRRPRIFHGLMGCQQDPRVGASHFLSLIRTLYDTYIHTYIHIYIYIYIIISFSYFNFILFFY